MIKRLALALALAALSVVANAAPPANISQTVGVCDPVYPQRCVKPDTNGAVPVTGSISATNPSVGTTGVAAPTSATEMGWIDGSGHLVAPSAANPFPVNATFSPSGTQDSNLKQVNGATVNVGAGAASTGTQRVTTSTDSTLGLVAGTAIIGKVGIDQTTPGTTNGVQVNAALPAGSNVIGHVIADTGSTTAVTGTVTVSGTVTANAGTNLNTSALALDATVGTTNTDIGPPGATACATDTGSCSINALAQRIAQRLTTVNTTLGTPIQATGGTVGLVAGTANIGQVAPYASSSTNGSTTVATGNTFQAALTSSASRKGCLIQNPTTASEVLYVNVGTLGSATTANSFSIAAGGSFSCNAGVMVITDAINVTAATSAHAFVMVSQ